MKKDYTKYSENTENKNIEPEVITMTDEEKEARIATIKELMSAEGVDEATLNNLNEELDKLEGRTYVVQTEDDGNVHIRPVVDGEIQNTPVENVITQEELQKDTTNEDVTPLDTGVVVGCGKLRVRKEPSKDSEEVCLLNKGSEVTIDPESTADFYKVYGSIDNVLFEGYCVKEFIKIK